MDREMRVQKVDVQTTDTRKDRADAIRIEPDNPPAGMGRAERREWEDKLWDELDSIEKAGAPGQNLIWVTAASPASQWAEAGHAGRVRLLKTTVCIKVRFGEGTGTVVLA